MLIGYARVSTQAQNLDRQLASLNAAGCTRIYAEKASGKSLHNRPELERAITALPTGGTLVIAEWDRATRSMLDGIAIMTRVYQNRQSQHFQGQRWFKTVGTAALPLIANATAHVNPCRRASKWVRR